MAKRVLSGQRPTGKLHLGHLHGTLNQWVELQKEYDTFFFVADWHALTTAYDDVSPLKADTQDMVIDWLALGIDPDKSVLYRQSDVSQVAELAQYLSILTPLGWLERNPTYKEQIKEIKGKEITTHGFLGYPVLQTADILIVHGEIVPVGEDQLPHLELSREIARRFNYYYGKTFAEPEAKLTKAAKVIGIDGRKMSKSYSNAIYLSDPPAVIKKKISQMITDPARKRRVDPGDPDVCNAFDLHRIYSKQNLKVVEKECRQALRGCVECKEELADLVVKSLEGFQEKRNSYEENPLLVKEVLEKGAETVRPIAENTIHEVRKKLNLD